MPLIEPTTPTDWTCPNTDCPEHGITKSGHAPAVATVLCGTCSTECDHTP